MATRINCEIKRERIPAFIADALPHRLSCEISGARFVGNIEEIRIRRGRAASLTVSGRNIILSAVIGGEELDRVFSELCGHSVYAYGETIKQGYLSLDGGVRVGVCGRAVCDGERIVGVYDVSAINIRLPMTSSGLGEPVCSLLRELDRGLGVLVYSPPAEGKTTLLRSVARKMSGGEAPLRVAVIDTRGELSVGLAGKNDCLDVLSGYPRGIGIEIATRTMNPELIVCDEIGDEREAEAIAAAQNSGVSLLASAHARDINGLLRRKGIASLHVARVFGVYVGIRKQRGDFLYEMTPWEEADAVFKACR